MAGKNKIGYASREELIKSLQLRLGDGMVDIELDREHYDNAIDLALARYRQLSSGSVEESNLFIQTTPGVTEYQLPQEVMEVRRLWRTGTGTNNSSGMVFDPYDAAFNNLYMLQAGQVGGMAVFDAFGQYKETMGRLFGAEYNFLWNRNTKILKLLRNINVAESVMVTIYNFVPEEVLLKDVYASNWLSSYSLAESKIALGEARGKYTSGLPGAGGGIQLNGDALKTEGREDKEKLDQQISLMEEGNSHLPFIVG